SDFALAYNLTPDLPARLVHPCWTALGAIFSAARASSFSTVTFSGAFIPVFLAVMPKFFSSPFGGQIGLSAHAVLEYRVECRWPDRVVCRRQQLTAIWRRSIAFGQCSNRPALRRGCRLSRMACTAPIASPLSRWRKTEHEGSESAPHCWHLECLATPSTMRHSMQRAM